MTGEAKRWDPADRVSAYTELAHPSDLFLEIRGGSLPELMEHALLAFYDQVADIDSFTARREVRLNVAAPGLDEALRSLLAEALFRFDTERFVAVGGQVTTEGGETAGDDPDADGRWRFSALLRGESAQAERHVLLREIKAVTYHRLAIDRTPGGWRATVLLDI